MQWWVLLTKPLAQGLTKLLLQFLEEVLGQFSTPPLQFRVSMFKFARLSQMWKLEYLQVWVTFPLEFLRYSFAIVTTVITDVMISVFEQQFGADRLAISRKLVLLVNSHSQSLVTVAQLLLSTCPLVAIHLFEVESDDLIGIVSVAIKQLSQFIRVREQHCVPLLDSSSVADFSRPWAAFLYFCQTHSCLS